MRENRGIELPTLVIASIASAAAAVIVSRFWIRGTPIAAALTPIIVTLISELLHRPTDKIAKRLTAETDALPEAAGAEPPPRSQETAPSPAPHDPQFTVYRSGSARRSRIAWATVLTTGLLAFAIAAVVLTVPELVGGGAIGGRDRATTLVPSKKGGDSGTNGGGKADGSDPTGRTETGQETVTETVPSESETVTETAPAEPPPRTTPTAPQQEQQQAPPPTTTTPAAPSERTPTTTAPPGQ